MKIRMLEHFQGRDEPTLAKGQEYDNVPEHLCSWLLEHNKAVEVKQEPESQKQPERVEEKPAEKKPIRARRKRGGTKK